ncbi:AraC family transcriptional regulator [Candidatus Endobugula sertula]|uniref:AraC family transcriptional regulator n=1 Tax=Candidatus Endobugula sertula TaxID=62101 RepID=A0A1D2QS43_9GAMM|nr:AraC family transcriptional regulator [Candidatus Endobugula sertula]
MAKVAFVLTEKMLLTSTSWPADMLNAANNCAKALCPKKPELMLMTVSACSLSKQRQSPFILLPDHHIDDVTDVDLIYLPALWRNPCSVLVNNHALSPWLQHHYDNGTIINGVGTGCCFMAEAGLLDHKPATTHWYYFDQFQKLYPLVQLKRQHFITQSGNLYCAASLNSLADLTIHFIKHFFNSAVAQHVERHFSHEIRQAYETASYFEDGNINHSDEEILQIQLWLKNNINKPIQIVDIAKQFSISTRNLNRRFKEATGKPPSIYIQDERIQIAKDLLQSSNLAIGDIADKVGYSDVSYFSQLFKKRLHITPKEYRTTVRAKLFYEQ